MVAWTEKCWSPMAGDMSHCFERSTAAAPRLGLVMGRKS